MFSKLALVVTFIAVGWVTAPTAFAQGSGSDLGSSMAGSAVGSGSAVATPATTAASVPTIPNPVDDPGGFLQKLKDAKSNGWPLVIMYGLYGLAELLAKEGKDIPKLAWLGKGRISVIIGGAPAVLAAVIAVMTHNGTWGAVGVAMLAFVAFFHTPLAADLPSAPSATPKA